jgi:hypothetical protein
VSEIAVFAVDFGERSGSAACFAYSDTLEHLDVSERFVHL